MKRVSFQGEHGAYSEGAAISFFKDIDAVPCQTFSDTLYNTVNGITDFSILPVENSIEGSVGESIDLLSYTTLNAVGEIYHRIEHCLIGTGTINETSTVYSHPQALGQCREFLQKHNMKTVPTYDTAGSVGIIRDLNRKDTACIASKNASKIYGIPVIGESIADNPNNHTRFLVFSKTDSLASGIDKTSIIFSIKHEPGTLYRIIETFHRNQVNLTKIESRPKKDTAWEYNFYVDFEGNKAVPSTASMLEEIKRQSLFFKILGSYPSARPD